MPDVKHAYVSGIADGGDSTLVQPSNWNAAHPWASAQDVGTLTLSTNGQFELQLVRMTLSSTNRLTLAGALTRIVIFGGTDTVASPNIVGEPKILPDVSFRIPNNYLEDFVGRLTLEKGARAILEGNADMYIVDDFGTRSRIVLAGRG